MQSKLANARSASATHTSTSRAFKWVSAHTTTASVERREPPAFLFSSPSFERTPDPRSLSNHRSPLVSFLGLQGSSLRPLPCQEGHPPRVPQRGQGHLQRRGGFHRRGDEEGIRRGRLVRKPPLLPQRAGRRHDPGRREDHQVQQEVRRPGPLRRRGEEGVKEWAPPCFHRQSFYTLD